MDFSEIKGSIECSGAWFQTNSKSLYWGDQQEYDLPDHPESKQTLTILAL